MNNYMVKISVDGEKEFLVAYLSKDIYMSGDLIEKVGSFSCGISEGILNLEKKFLAKESIKEMKVSTYNGDKLFMIKTFEEVEISNFSEYFNGASPEYNVSFKYKIDENEIMTSI